MQGFCDLRLRIGSNVYYPLILYLRSKNCRRPAALSFKPKTENAISTCAHFERFRGLQRYAPVRLLQR